MFLFHIFSVKFFISFFLSSAAPDQIPFCIFLFFLPLQFLLTPYFNLNEQNLLSLFPQSVFLSASTNSLFPHTHRLPVLSWCGLNGPVTYSLWVSVCIQVPTAITSTASFFSSAHLYKLKHYSDYSSSVGCGMKPTTPFSFTSSRQIVRRMVRGRNC